MAESAHPLVLRAREAFARSEIKSAELAVEERLKTAGRDINALEMRYLIQKHRGQLGEAARTLDTVIGINSRAEWAHNALIQLLMAHGKVSDAEQVARAALRVNPNNTQANRLFGSIISDTGNLHAGEWHLRRAVEIGPDAMSLASLAENLSKQGRQEEAERYFSRALEIAPDDVRTLVSWANLCDERGNLEQAGKLIDRAAAIAPDEVSLPRANHLARAGRHEEALATLNAAKALTGEAQLARGRVHERLGRYEEAWQDFVAGKRKLASDAGGLQYKADAVESLFERFKQFFTRENIERMPRAKLRTDVAQPVFIMGPPCSGATFVERILGNHSKVTVGGELPFLAELRKVATDVLPAQQQFPENLAQSWVADRRYAATVWRDYYLARAESYGLLDGGKAFFTDRMPFNEVFLPLVKLAFPRAKIVRVARHPLDVCVSIMSKPMAHGFHCGYRIEDTAHHLAATFDLSQHYQGVLDLPDYVLRYEGLVADAAGEIRKLLDYLELPFEDECLRSTAGRIDKSSVDRRRHYDQPLRVLASRLKPMMTAYGYA